MGKGKIIEETTNLRDLPRKPQGRKGALEIKISYIVLRGGVYYLENEEYHSEMAKNRHKHQHHIIMTYVTYLLYCKKDMCFNVLHTFRYFSV